MGTGTDTLTATATPGCECGVWDRQSDLSVLQNRKARRARAESVSTLKHRRISDGGTSLSLSVETERFRFLPSRPGNERRPQFPATDLRRLASTRPALRVRVTRQPVVPCVAPRQSSGDLGLGGSCRTGVGALARPRAAVDGGRRVGWWPISPRPSSPAAAR